jgi:hypothetical protein
MVPSLLHQVGQWLDRFSEALNRWESLLQQVEAAYLQSDCEAILELSKQGDSVHSEIDACKRDRLELLEQAHQAGVSVRQLKDLAVQLDGHWPALWTHRIAQLELQLNRIQRLSMSLWVGAFQSKSTVAEMLLILATGKSDTATYSPSESHSFEGGQLVNEAA